MDVELSSATLKEMAFQIRFSYGNRNTHSKEIGSIDFEQAKNFT